MAVSQQFEVRLDVNYIASKKDSSIRNILKLSFEYMLAGIMKEYSEIESIADTSEFNRKNTVSRSVVLAYPFFVALSNGHGETLYSLFGEFQTSEYGPVSLSLKDIIQGDNHLQYFTINEFDILVNNSEKFKQFDDIKNDILKQDIPDSSTKFEKIGVKQEKSEKYSSLYSALDRAIAIIKRQSSNTFFNGRQSTVKFQSSYFAILENRLGKTTENEAMPYLSVEKTSRRPFYEAS